MACLIGVQDSPADQRLLTLLKEQLDQLWEAHRRCGSRELRDVLRLVEEVVADERGVDVRTFRHQRKAQIRS